MSELLIGQPIFPGESGVDQLVEIIKVLGTPTREQILAMNKNYTEFKFPQIKPSPWSKACRLPFPIPQSRLFLFLSPITPRPSPIPPIMPPSFAFLVTLLIRSPVMLVSFPSPIVRLLFPRCTGAAASSFRHGGRMLWYDVHESAACFALSSAQRG